MKRSEMLRLIEETISPCNSTYKDHRVKAANRILDAIEEAGMQPPMRTERSRIGTVYAVSRWEEE